MQAVPTEKRFLISERAVLRDWDTTEKIGVIEGEAHIVRVIDAVQQAREEGRRITVEHNHGNANVSPSPWDVAFLLQNADVMMNSGISYSYAETIVARSQLQPGEGLSDAAQKLLGRMLATYQDANGKLLIPEKTWYDIFNRVQKIQGAITYETTK